MRTNRQRSGGPILLAPAPASAFGLCTRRDLILSTRSRARQSLIGKPRSRLEVNLRDRSNGALEQHRVSHEYLKVLRRCGPLGSRHAKRLPIIQAPETVAIREPRTCLSICHDPISANYEEHQWPQTSTSAAQSIPNTTISLFWAS